MYRAFLFKSFAADLKEARLKRKLTQAQLAASSGVRQATISRLEKQTGNDVNVATLEKLAAALHANLEIKITLAEVADAKPAPTPGQLKELTIYEVERLQRMRPDPLNPEPFDPFDPTDYFQKEIDEMQAAGKRVPDEFLPTKEEDKWAGRYTVTTIVDPRTGLQTDHIDFDTDDEEMMNAFMNGEFG